MGKWFRPTQKEIDDIINLYKSGLGTKPLSKKYSCSENTIRRILDDNKIEHHIKGGIQKYFFNENFLDELNTSEKLYFLGWLYSDGNVSKTENLVRIGLASKDREVLEVLNLILENERPLREEIEHGEERVVLSLCSKHFKDRLIELGCVPNKSNVLTYPDWVPQEYLRDFIRGYYDGDGSLVISQSKNGIKQGIITIASTFNFISKLQKVIKENLGIEGKIRPFKKESLCYGYFIYAQEEILKFLEWLYFDNNCVKLQRKWNLYKELKQSRKNLKIDKSAQQKIVRDNKNEIIRLYKEEHLSVKKLSEKFGVHINTVYRIIRENRNQQGAN